jgi:hypothetical protein
MKKNQAKKERQQAVQKRLAKPDIKYAAPAAYGSSHIVGQPRINGGNGVVVSHTEYLDDILGQTTFQIDPTVQVYQINPGLITSFPWLGNMAAGYEQYRFKKLRFRYQPRVGSSTNAVVYFSTQLDSNDADFSSKEEMYAYAGTKSSSVWVEMYHDCLLGRGDYMKKYFIRTGDVAMDDEIQLYDVGKFTFVAITASANLFVGELLVDYEVELFNPKMNVLDVGAGANFSNAATGTSVDPFAGAITRALWGAADFVKLTTDSIQFVQTGLYNLSVHFTSTGSLVSLTPDKDGEITVNSEHYNTPTTTSYGYYVAWVLVGLTGALITFQFGGGAAITSLVKVNSSPLALAANLGVFTSTKAGVVESMNRRYRKRRIKFALVEAGDRKENLREVARDEPPVKVAVQDDHKSCVRCLDADIRSRSTSPKRKPL